MALTTEQDLQNQEEILRVLEAGAAGASASGRELGRWIASHTETADLNPDKNELSNERAQLNTEINQMNEQELDLVWQLVNLIKDRRER